MVFEFKCKFCKQTIERSDKIITIRVEDNFNGAISYMNYMAHKTCYDEFMIFIESGGDYKSKVR